MHTNQTSRFLQDCFSVGGAYANVAFLGGLWAFLGITWGFKGWEVNFFTTFNISA